jgi:predicted  nucleic acid-binding Zn-ribbon protein
MLASDYYEPNLSAMSEERGDLILEHLRPIRSEIGDLKTSMVEVKERLGFLEAQYASISRRVDRIDGRLERIERRLDLVEA